MEKFPVINGLRGLAIAAVLFFHLSPDRITRAGWQAAHLGKMTLSPFVFFSNAHQGVALFFFLSGFVLFLPYARGERWMGRKNDVLGFYRHRARRLLPLYYFSVLCGAAFVYPHEFWRYGLLMATLTFNLRMDTFWPPFNPVLWSLGVEFWFCVLFPLLVVAAQRIGIIRLLFIVLASSLAVRLVGFLFLPSLLTVLAEGMLGRLDDFVWGMVLADIFVRRQSALRRTWLLPGFICLLVALQVYDWNKLEITPMVLRPFTNILLDLSLFLMTASLLVRKSGVAVRFVTLWPIQMVGVMCYSIYVWHQMLFGQLAPTYDVVHFIRYCLILGGLSFLSYRFIEFGHVADIRLLLPMPFHRLMSNSQPPKFPPHAVVTRASLRRLLRRLPLPVSCSLDNTGKVGIIPSYHAAICGNSTDGVRKSPPKASQSGGELSASGASRVRGRPITRKVPKGIRV